MSNYRTGGRNINDLCKEFYNSGFDSSLSIPDAVLRWQHAQGYLFNHVSPNWWAIAQDVGYRYHGDIDIQNRFATGELELEPDLDPSAETLIGRMNVEPTLQRKKIINQLVVDLKAAGVWDKLDDFHVLAAHDQQAGRLNWVSGAYGLIPSGGPVFTVDKGYKGDGVGAVLNKSGTTFAKFGLDDASFGCFISDWDSFILAQGTATVLNNRTGTLTSCIWPKTSVGIRYRFNSETTRGPDVPIVDYEVIGIDQLSGSGYTYYKGNLAHISSNAATSRTPVDSILGTTQGGSVSAAFSGASLGDAGHAAMSTALNKYMTAIGLI